jgi:acetyltransferase-like isoleucine patch superfamily enzyme
MASPVASSLTNGNQLHDEMMAALQRAVYQPHTLVGQFKFKLPLLISEDCKIDISNDIMIGQHFMMNKRSTILRHTHPTGRDAPLMLQALKKTNTLPPLEIGDDVWMQQGTLIMPNVTHIHRGSIIVVGSILTKNTTCEYGIWAGTPAKLIKMRE